MTQVARRASLVALLLLASVGTASAECAWVLWVEYPRSGYSPLDAFQTREACDGERYSERTRKLAAEVSGFPLCPPDTVDPRGPKAN
jgi:hypothetical protein